MNQRDQHKKDLKILAQWEQGTSGPGYQSALRTVQKRLEHEAANSGKNVETLAREQAIALRRDITTRKEG